MAKKEYTKVMKLQRELATALKEEILGKLKTNTLYCSSNNRKFYRLQDNGDSVLVVLDTNKMYDSEFECKLGELIFDNLEIKQIALFTGCWGMTNSPVGAVRESNKKELKKYFDKLYDRLCDILRNIVNSAFNNVAVEMDFIKMLESDDDLNK